MEDRRSSAEEGRSGVRFPTGLLMSGSIADKALIDKICFLRFRSVGEAGRGRQRTCVIGTDNLSQTCHRADMMPLYPRLQTSGCVIGERMIAAVRLV